MGEKKRRLASRRTGQQPQYFELIEQGFRALNAGDSNTAQGIYARLLDLLPEDPEAIHALGVLGSRLGQPVQAEKLLRMTVEKCPHNTAYRCNFAMALRSLGRLPEAIAQLRIAVELQPDFAEAHVNLGTLLIDVGSVEEAGRSFEQALACKPGYADAMNGLGSTRFLLRRYQEACQSFERAVELDPGFHQAYSNLAAARLAWARSPDSASSQDNLAISSANLTASLEAISTALQLSPTPPAYWSQFASCVQGVRLRYPVEGFSRELLLRALDHPAVNPMALVPAVAGLAGSHPSAREIKGQLSASGTFDTLAWENVKHLVTDVLADALLQRVLADAIVSDAFLERMVAFARRATLREIRGQPIAEPSLPPATILAIALQSFNTEYIYEESDDDRLHLDALLEDMVKTLDAGEQVPISWFAVYACYRPLHCLAHAEEIAKILLATPFRLLAIRQIVEPVEERRLRSSISALTGVAGEVTVAVQAQYEVNPYPRWIRTEQDQLPLSVPAALKVLFPAADLSGVPTSPPRVLIAGCGTGQHPINTAKRFLGANILAVDLSLSSLAYAVRKTRELGITTIEYRQGDLLALETIPERFDVIESSGVLHHLENPLRGWRILVSLLRPGGLMRVGLYSEAARQDVMQARKLIAAQGYRATPEGIRRSRTAIRAGGQDELLAKIARRDDFYSLSGCRDLLFHVQEHRFTLPQIAEMLEELNLKFIGFEFPDTLAVARYRSTFPDDPTMDRLENWDRFENVYPDTFRNMYQFWVRRRN